MLLCTGVTVLVDPWLVGQLTFGGLSWVYAGNKKGPKLDPKAIAAGADFMLITQARHLIIGLEQQQPDSYVRFLDACCMFTYAVERRFDHRDDVFTPLAPASPSVPACIGQQKPQVAEPLCMYPRPGCDFTLRMTLQRVCAVVCVQHDTTMHRAGSAGPRAQANAGAAAA